MAESVPPLTAADIKVDLNNPTFAVYLYIGKASDIGWKNAQAAFKFIPRLRIYRIKNPNDVSEWAGTKRPAAICFGWGPKVFKLLNKSQAEDLSHVLQSISDAMQ